MIASEQELFAVLRQYNPWWSAGRVPDLPDWRRVAFTELHQWISSPPAPRAVLLSGARQTGKTTLLSQSIAELLSAGIRPEQILYATLDHPLLKLIGLKGLIDTWRKIYPSSDQTDYLYLDEIQYAKDWQTWLKHQVDFNKNRRIAVTGSAVPLAMENPESGVGRWHTIKLPTLSFFEYLRIKNVAIPDIRPVSSLRETFSWSKRDILQTAETAIPLVPHFHNYILQGGFPQTAVIENLSLAQKLLREDIVDKVLKRDMTAYFGVRRILELEKTFLYLCLHEGGILDVTQLCTLLELKKPTVMRFLEILESAHLIYKLPRFGYGKEVLRARQKVYLADASIAGSVLLKGSSLLEDGPRLGAAIETAFFKHVFTRYYQTSVGFSYWKGKRDLEVDIIAEAEGDIIPFEVKYTQGSIGNADLRGLKELCSEKRISRAYLVGRDFDSFGVVNLTRDVQVLCIPAPLACLWLSQWEHA